MSTLAGLSAAKMEAVVTVVRTLPDEALRTLKSALAAQVGQPWTLPVRDAIEDELADRRLRNLVFGELVTACIASRARPKPIPASAVGVVWSALRAHDPKALAAADALLAAREGDAFDVASLDLVAVAAEGLETAEGPFEKAVARLEATPGTAGRAAHILRLAPIVRSCTPRARAWLKMAGPEDASALRLGLRDASALSDDGGPTMIDLVASSFSDPRAGLRLVSAVMDRPAEVFLAGSELSAFAEDLMDEVDAALERIQVFDADRGREGGAATAAAIDSALDGLEEMEHAVQLDRERPWGKRVAAQRRAIALAAEARLKEADGFVAAALPTRSGRPGSKQIRGAPNLKNPLDPLAITRAEAVLAFIDGVRRAAGKGGFGGMRAKVIEALDGRIDTYIEDLLEQLHSGAAVNGDDLRERLQIAADFLGMVRDPSAAQIVRRRMAAAAAAA